eukprot:TRINITY_DN2031_c0_g1_i3.p1 TRINITY_DN2031_c0_g1~~TRINITY_DN2031_c0_g1_i3.p1  ORF type:complete len:1010 (+),score=254.88 TRINITY_DN2031_c0_g1_i3:22-3030(+)
MASRNYVEVSIPYRGVRFRVIIPGSATIAELRQRILIDFEALHDGKLDNPDIRDIRGRPLVDDMTADSLEEGKVFVLNPEDSSVQAKPPAVPILTKSLSATLFKFTGKKDKDKRKPKDALSCDASPELMSSSGEWKRAQLARPPPTDLSPRPPPTELSPRPPIITSAPLSQSTQATPTPIASVPQSQSTLSVSSVAFSSTSSGSDSSQGSSLASSPSISPTVSTRDMHQPGDSGVPITDVDILRRMLAHQQAENERLKESNMMLERTLNMVGAQKPAPYPDNNGPDPPTHDDVPKWTTSHSPLVPRARQAPSSSSPSSSSSSSSAGLLTRDRALGAAPLPAPFLNQIVELFPKGLAISPSAPATPDITALRRNRQHDLHMKTRAETVPVKPNKRMIVTGKLKMHAPVPYNDDYDEDDEDDDEEAARAIPRSRSAPMLDSWDLYSDDVEMVQPTSHNPSATSIRAPVPHHDNEGRWQASSPKVAFNGVSTPPPPAPSAASTMSSSPMRVRLSPSMQLLEQQYSSASIEDVVDSPSPSPASTPTLPTLLLSQSRSPSFPPQHGSPSASPWLSSGGTAPRPRLMSALKSVSQVIAIPPPSPATLCELVQWLVHYNRSASAVDTFLLTFRTFSTPSMFLRQLVRLFNTPPAGSPFLGERHKLCRTRVIYILRKWVSQYYENDLRNSQELIEEIEAFLDLIARSNPEHARFRDMILPMLRGCRPDMHAPVVFINQPKPLVAKSLEPWAIELLSLHPEEVVRQLTVIEFELFQSIGPGDFMNTHLSPNVKAFVARFNTVSSWVATEIVITPSLKKRRATLQRFITLAERCLMHHNYNTLMELLAGLNMRSVLRLRRTWEGIPSKFRRVFHDLERTMDNRLNYSAYRERLQEAGGLGQPNRRPVLPYFGVFLRDMTFLDEGQRLERHDSRVFGRDRGLEPPGPEPREGTVIFDRLEAIANLVKLYQSYQAYEYPFAPVPMLQNYFRNLVALPEDVLDKYSLASEPVRDA